MSIGKCILHRNASKRLTRCYMSEEDRRNNILFLLPSIRLPPPYFAVYISTPLLAPRLLIFSKCQLYDYNMEIVEYFYI